MDRSWLGMQHNMKRCLACIVTYWYFWLGCVIAGWRSCRYGNAFTLDRVPALVLVDSIRMDWILVLVFWLHRDSSNLIEDLRSEGIVTILFPAYVEVRQRPHT